MKDLRILAPREVGKGILVEYDAGYINPMERRNLDLTFGTDMKNKKVSE